MLIVASYEAWERGQPFNRYGTILWERAGVDARENRNAIRQFLKRCGDWMRPLGWQLFHVWVQEYGSINGAHVHMLLHVPPALDPLFRSKPRHWATLRLPGDYVAGTVQCQRIKFGRDPDGNPLAYEAALMGKLHYMLKCAPLPLETELDMTRWRSPWSKRWGQSGVTFGKRAGRWQDRIK